MFGAFAGALSESLNRKTIVVLALVIPAVVSTVLATLATMDLLSLWHVALGNLVSGTMWATEMPTRRRMVGEIAGPSRIVPAIALDSATSAATRMIGPLLGGIAFQWRPPARPGRRAGARVGRGRNGLRRGRLRLQPGPPRPQQHARQEQLRRLDLARLPAEIAEGLVFAARRPTILLVYGVTIVTNAFAFAYSGLEAPLGIGAFHVSPALVGVLAAAEPMGALIGGALIAAGLLRMDRRLAFAGGAALFMVTLIVMSLSPFYWLAFAALVIGGFGTAGFGNMQSTLMLTEAPPEMRSRLMGLVTVCIGTGPLGVLLAGAIATEIGPRAAVAVMSTVGLILTVALAAWVRRRATPPA